MAGYKGENRDGNKYILELGNELSRILNSFPDYYMGLQYGVLYNSELRDFVFNKLFYCRDINWVNGDILHQASEFGHLREFVEALKYRNTIIIGAKYFIELPYHHITTPEIDSYHENDGILMEIKNRFSGKYTKKNPVFLVDRFSGKYTKKNPVFLVASAMNSNIIIDRLPNNVTAIDIGSVFDPYLGKPRASYQHKLKADWLW
jgi:hypothetical protein